MTFLFLRISSPTAGKNPQMKYVFKFSWALGFIGISSLHVLRFY